MGALNSHRNRTRLSIGIIAGAVFAALAVSGPSLAGNVFGGGGGGAGGVASSLVCLLTGGSDCTMTGQTIYSGVTSDITTGPNEDLTLAPNGTGSVLLRSGDNATEFVDSAGNPDLTIETTTSGGGISLIRTSNSAVSGGAVRISTNIATLGTLADVSATTVAGCIGDTLTTGTATALWCVYGGGLWAIDKQQSVTISTGTDTTVPTSSQVEMTCTTAPCSYSPGETSIPDGAQIEVCNIDASDDITIAEAAGVVRTRGGAGFVLKSGGDCATCTYSGAIWGCH